MPLKRLPPPPFPFAPARVPAAHVQAAIVKAAQAKIPATGMARPVAPHVQNALMQTGQANSYQGAAVDPRGRVPARPAQAVAARAAQAKLGSVVPERPTPWPASSKGTIQLSATLVATPVPVVAAAPVVADVPVAEEKKKAGDGDVGGGPAGRPRRASVGVKHFEPAETVKLRMRAWALENERKSESSTIDVFCKKIADQIASDLKIGEGTVAVAILTNGTYVVARLQSALTGAQVRASVAKIETAESVQLTVAPTTTAPKTNLHAEMMIWQGAPTMMEVAASRPCCKLCARFLESKSISYPDVGDWPKNGWINPETGEAYVA
jgi:hypothetical protein